MQKIKIQTNEKNHHFNSISSLLLFRAKKIILNDSRWISFSDTASYTIYFGEYGSFISNDTFKCNWSIIDGDRICFFDKNNPVVDTLFYSIDFMNEDDLILKPENWPNWEDSIFLHRFYKLSLPPQVQDMPRQEGSVLNMPPPLAPVEKKR
jgi:hypothetical protein